VETTENPAATTQFETAENPATITQFESQRH
jgi:hypothetical protein